MKMVSVSAAAVLALSAGLGQIVSKVTDKVEHAFDLHSVQLCHTLPENLTFQEYENGIAFKYRGERPLVLVTCGGGYVRAQFL